MAQVDKWECRLDSAGRRRYYLNDKFVPAKNVPTNVLNKIDCGALKAKSHTKKIPVKKEVPKRILTNSYIDLLPLELIKLLMLYFNGKELQNICEVETLKRICDDDEFWHKLVLTQFTSHPRAKPETKSWKGWRDFYIQLDKLIPHNKSLGTQIGVALAYDFNKFVERAINDITDPELLYAILIDIYFGDQPDFEVIKKLVIDKKVDWPNMYAKGKSLGTHNWISLLDKYDINLQTNRLPIHSNYPVEIVDYLLSLMPDDYPYYNSVIQYIMNVALPNENIQVVQYILANYPDVVFDFEVLTYTHPKDSEKFINMLKILKAHGLDLSIDNNVLLKNAIWKNHIQVVKFLHEQGVDIHAQDDIALSEAAFYGHLDIVKYLIEHGADIHADNDRALRSALDRLTFGQRA